MSKSFQWYRWSQNPTVWLDKRQKWPQLIKVVVSHAACSWWLTPGKKTEIYLHAKILRNSFILSKDIDDQGILWSDWLRACYAITEKPVGKSLEKSNEPFLMKTVYWTTELLTGNFKRSFLSKGGGPKRNKQTN